jgi:hypothetical protein
VWHITTLRVPGTAVQFKYACLVILILLNLIITAQAWENEDLYWTDSKTKTLHWGDTFEIGNYTIEAYDFPRTEYKGQIGTRYVGINLYESDVLVETQSLMIWDNFTYDGEIRITVADLMSDTDIRWKNDTYDPWASVTAQLRALPDIDISVKTNADSYKLTNSKISVTITAKNKGDAPLEDVDLFINTDGLEFHQFCKNKSTHYMYDIIDKGQTQTETFELNIPSNMINTVYNISVNVSGIDQKDEMHDYSGSKEITVMNMINITKTTKSNIFMTDTAYVQLTIVNHGTYAVNNIKLKDAIGDNFELIGNTPLLWNLDLGPAQYKDYQYTIKPIKPDKDGCKLPQAEAVWTVGGIEYDQTCIAPTIIIHGSKILLEKTLTPSNAGINAEVTVTVTATNVGDVKASVEIFDDFTLPDNVFHVSGELHTKKILDEDQSVSLSYVISSDTEGIYKLPEARAQFTDLQGYQGEEISNSLSFTAGNPVVATSISPGQTQAPTSSPGPTPVATRTQPGFEILIGLIGLILAVWLAFRK